MAVVEQIEAQLHDDDAPLGPLPLDPREELELECYCEPDAAHGDPRRQHLKRLLAAAILLCSAGHFGEVDEFSAEAHPLDCAVRQLARFTASAMAIGDDVESERWLLGLTSFADDADCCDDWIHLARRAGVSRLLTSESA